MKMTAIAWAEAWCRARLSPMKLGLEAWIHHRYTSSVPMKSIHSFYIFIWSMVKNISGALSRDVGVCSR